MIPFGSLPLGHLASLVFLPPVVDIASSLWTEQTAGDPISLAGQPGRRVPPPEQASARQRPCSSWGLGRRPGTRPAVAEMLRETHWRRAGGWVFQTLFPFSPWSLLLSCW